MPTASDYMTVKWMTTCCSHYTPLISPAPPIPPHHPLRLLTTSPNAHPLHLPLETPHYHLRLLTTSPHAHPLHLPLKTPHHRLRLLITSPHAHPLHLPLETPHHHHNFTLETPHTRDKYTCTSQYLINSNSADMSRSYQFS